MQRENQVYKDIQNQNFIELRFSPRDAKQLSSEEALNRYKRNAYILGRIFSYNQNKEQIDDEKFEPDQDQIQSAINQEKVEEFKESYENLIKKHEEKLKNFKDRQTKHWKGQENIQNFIDELIKDNYYAADHPFFKKNSPFYLSISEDILRKVEEQDQQEQIKNFEEMEFATI